MVVTWTTSCVPGYDHMDINRIKETARSRWDDKLDRLHLFMVDPYRKRYGYFKFSNNWISLIFLKSFAL